MDDEDDGGLVGDSDELEFVEWKNHDPLPLPAFMRGRPTVGTELENCLGLPPFQSFSLLKGQVSLLCLWVLSLSV